MGNIYVTTEDEEIAGVAQSFGVTNIIKRPKALSRPSVHAVEPVLHILETQAIADTSPVAMLLPTSPFRTAADIDAAFSLLARCDSVIGVTDGPRFISLRKGTKNSEITPLIVPKDHSGLNVNRQEAEHIYVVNGAMFITTAKILKTWKTFHAGKCFGYYMPKMRSLDIDTMDDFEIAEALARTNHV